MSIDSNLLKKEADWREYWLNKLTKGMLKSIYYDFWKPYERPEISIYKFLSFICTTFELDVDADRDNVVTLARKIESFGHADMYMTSSGQDFLKRFVADVIKNNGEANTFIQCPICRLPVFTGTLIR